MLHYPMRLFCLLFLILLLLVACNPPPKPDQCVRFPVDAQLPQPVLRRIAINGQNHDPQNLKIGALEEDILIELEPAAVDSYCFKLNAKGLNPCGLATPYPQIHFTFLSGGTYTLEYWVQKDSASSVHKTLNFRVDQALSEKEWFYPVLVGYILLIAGAIVYFWTLYNIRQKLKLQKIRSRIAADLHDEVSSDLSSIGISITTLERRNATAPREFREALREIKQTLADTQNNLSDTVWAIKPDKDSDGELFQHMQKFARQMFASADTRLIFQNTIPQKKSLKISMEQRHNIFKIYKEAIHNIHKHARATEVEVRIYPLPDAIGLTIRDNGIGFDTGAEHDGNGIGNYEWRAAESFIDFKLESTPGKGTFIQMLIPQF